MIEDKLNNLSKEKLINIIARNNVPLCIRCGNNRDLNISVSTTYTSPRKLCGLCHDCYVELLDFIGVSDVLEEEVK